MNRAYVFAILLGALSAGLAGAYEAAGSYGLGGSGLSGWSDSGTTRTRLVRAPDGTVCQYHFSEGRGLLSCN